MFVRKSNLLFLWYLPFNKKNKGARWWPSIPTHCGKKKIGWQTNFVSGCTTRKHTHYYEPLQGKMVVVKERRGNESFTSKNKSS